MRIEYSVIKKDELTYRTGISSDLPEIVTRNGNPARDKTLKVLLASSRGQNTSVQQVGFIDEVLYFHNSQDGDPTALLVRPIYLAQDTGKPEVIEAISISKTLGGHTLVTLACAKRLARDLNILHLRHTHNIPDVGFKEITIKGRVTRFTSATDLARVVALATPPESRLIIPTLRGFTEFYLPDPIEEFTSPFE